MRSSGLDRLLLLLTGLLASYQIVVGIDSLGGFVIAAYTIAFGVLLVAGLLLLILGYGILDSPLVVVVSTVIPLSLATGLVWEYLSTYRTPYLLFTLIGFLAVIVTRSFPFPKKLSVIVLACTHGVAGMVIFLLPILFVTTGQAGPGFALVGLGGALIGLVGLLLSFLKMGRPILSREMILKVFPGLLLLMTACFVAGFNLV